MKLKLRIALLALFTAVIPLALFAEGDTARAVASRDAARAFANLPLHFEPAVEPGRFLARSGGGYSVLVGADESAIAMTDKSGSARTLHFSFDHSNAAATVEAVDPLPGVTNYYLGSDEHKWRLGVRNFARLRAHNVYPGVDVVYYGDNRRLEFDFVVAPQADPGAIALSLSGMDKLSTDANGDLLAELSGRIVRFARPSAYQTVAGVAKPVSVEYVLAGNKAQLRLGNYDKNRELVIDPLLSYATYLGGVQGDTATGIAVDSTGYAYITGTTCSSSFIGASNTYGGCSAFVTKLNPAGTATSYITIIGGNNTASGNAIALDTSDNAYIAGTTNSNSGLPSALNTYNGGDSDAFIAEISATGTLFHTVYLGGSGADTGSGITVDSSANVIIGGQTNSSDFPSYSGFEDKIETAVAFVTKLDNNLDVCVSGARYADSGTLPTWGSPTGTCYFSLFYGGQPPNVPGNSVGNPGYWIANHQYLYGDVISVSYYNPISGTYTNYAEKCNAAGTSGSTPPNWGSASSAGSVTSDGTVTWLNEGAPGTLVYAATQANGVAVDPLGDVFATGGSSSQFIGCSTCSFSNYIGAGAWVLKVSGLAPSNSSFVQRRTYSTVLGTTSTDVGNGIAVDTQGRAYVVGTSTGGIFVTNGAYQTSNAGSQDAFVLNMNTAGTAINYATYLGGSGDDQGLAIAVDTNGATYITGSTKSTNFPITNPLLNQTTNATMSTLTAEENAFVAELIPGGSALAFSTYLGGTSTSDSDYGTAIAVYPDANSNDMYVAGVTNSPDFPVYPPTTVVDPTYGNNGDAFVALILGKTIPNVSVTPSTLAFGSQTENTASAAQTVTVANSGSTALTITSISVSGNFAATYTCGATLAANSSCTISVTFTPTTTGAQSGTLTIADSGTNSPQTVALSGTGTALTTTGGGGATSTIGFTLTGPSTDTVTSGTPSTFTITLTPTGGFDQTVTLSCAGSDGATCSVSPTSVVVSGSTASTATVTVTYTSSSSGGSTVQIGRLIKPGRLLATLLPFGGIGLVFVGRRKRWLLLLGLIVCLAIGLAGCSGGKSSSSGSTTPQVTITATPPAGTASTQTLTVPLTVS